ncbi:MAG TPA: type II toxin-antitoxin system RelE/ParE family toxin [Candidatus Acidoferrales bacterium]|nr:type II toxin-antitoxin system RelE/ParE family toxin [Candidatus Acidoferrales bacterium]
MPAYRVDVQRSAERDLDRLSPTLFERITERLAALAEQPRPPGAEKLVGLEAYRIRVGDYRLIYEVDDSARVIVVTRVRHRREVYRKLR